MLRTGKGMLSNGSHPLAMYALGYWWKWNDLGQHANTTSLWWIEIAGMLKTRVNLPFHIFFLFIFSLCWRFLWRENKGEINFFVTSPSHCWMFIRNPTSCVGFPHQNHVSPPKCCRWRASGACCCRIAKFQIWNDPVLPFQRWRNLPLDSVSIHFLGIAFFFAPTLSEENHFFLL